MKVTFLKGVDGTVGWLGVRMIASPLPAETPGSTRSLLLIRPGGIGDAVLLVPAIRTLKEAYPDARITALAEKRNGAIFSLCPAAERVLLYDRPKDLFAAVRGSYDVVIDTEQWHRLSAVVARMTGAPISTGFATNEREKLFTHPIPYSHDDYEAESFFHLLVPLGIAKPAEIKAPFLTIPPVAAEKVAELLGDFAGKPFVAIFPGASIPERRWGGERFQELARRLHGCGVPVVVIGAKEDQRDGEVVVAGKYGLNLAGKTSLVETAAVIDRVAVLVSGDSGILHIGVGLDKPTVSLFGPGIAKKWAPRGENHIVIIKELPCSPCTTFGYTPKCPIGAKCMAEISVDEVAEAVEWLMEKSA